MHAIFDGYMAEGSFIIIANPSVYVSYSLSVKVSVKMKALSYIYIFCIGVSGAQKFKGKKNHVIHRRPREN